MGKSKIRFIQTGDWHLGQTWPSLSSDASKLLKAKQNEIGKALTEACRDHQVDFLILTGDIFDRVRPERQCLTFFVRLITELADLPIIVAPGNHDPMPPGAPWLGEKWPANVHIFSRENSIFEFPDLNTVFTGLAFEHQTAARPGYFPDFNVSDGSAFQIAVAHGDLLDRNSPFRPLSPELIRSSNADYFAAGHNHQLIIDEQSEVPYASAGAPIGRSFREPGSKSFLYGELSGDLIKGGRANLDLVTRKQMQKLKNTQLKLQEYPLFLPTFERIEYQCLGNESTADIIRHLQQQIRTNRVNIHPDSLWQLVLRGKKSRLADIGQLRQYFQRNLLYIEILDERTLPSFPGQERRLLFPGFALTAERQSTDHQQQADESRPKHLAITYLASATENASAIVRQQEFAQLSTAPESQSRRSRDAGQ